MHLSYSFQTWTCIFCFCIYILLHEESLNVASYQEPHLESYCDSLIREKDKLTHIGIINNVDTYGKALLSQQKEKSKPPKKHNFRNNKPNKCPKPSQSSPSLKNDKGDKPKWKKSERHCNYCGKDNHYGSKCFKKMTTLDATMKKHHISLDSFSESTSHGHALYAFGYSYTASSSSTSNEWLIDSGASYHWLRIKPYFLLCMNVTPNKYLLVMIDL